MLAEAQVEQREIRQPGRKRGSTKSGCAARPGGIPASPADSMNTEPAAQACGTLAPMYCTGKSVSSRSNAA